MKVVIKEKVLESGKNFIIYDIDDKYLINVEKNVVSLQDKIVISNYLGDTLYLIDESPFNLSPEYGIFDSSSEIIRLKKKSGRNNHFEIKAVDSDMKLENDLLGNHIKLFINNQLKCKIAEHIRGFSRVFEIEILDESKKELILTIALTICQMFHGIVMSDDGK